MAESWKKKDREQKKLKEKNDKAERCISAKRNPKKSFDEMIAYTDVN